ncbi:hypothetical protein FRC08_005069 [Ceratobasidium sp. 394]|nr:hypothetical protein FRC08_005069 [Ceratobasidium sp. 394]
MSFTESDSKTVIGIDDELKSYDDETVRELQPPRTEHSRLVAKLQLPRAQRKQKKSMFDKLLKSTQALYDHLGQDTWILDRRLETLDKAITSDEAVFFLASVVPKSSETKQLYRMLDEYLDRPEGFRTKEPEVDETIEMIELGVWHILDIPSVAEPLLGMLGRSYETRFRQRGELSDINKSIDSYARGIALTTATQAGRPILLNNQGNAYLARFKRLGDPTDIDKAIEVFARAASLVSTDLALKSMMQNNLGIAYSTRFRHTSALTDIDEALKHHYRALSFLPDGHASRSDRLESIGLAYSSRFGRLGRITDINSAIANQEQAISLAPNDHARQFIRLCNLGAAYLSRSKHQASTQDIQTAIDRLSEALALAPPGSPEIPTVLSNLGSAYRCRFQSLYEPSDIDKAIEVLSQALPLCSDGGPENSWCHCNLGISYEDRFDSNGELGDLQLAIYHKNQAAQLAPDGNPAKPGYLSNLGISYHTRYRRLGELADLERAIECHKQAVSLTPDGHPDMPKRLNSLGSSYQSRFERLDDVTDIDKALEYIGRAASLIPNEHPDFPTWLANLGTVHLCRFNRLGNDSDLEAAIDQLDKAASLTPNELVKSSTWLDNLGAALIRRFKHLGKLEDVDRAIEYQTRALTLIPEGHTEKPARLNSLGSSYCLRFNHQGKQEDIEKSIEYQTLAVSLTPQGHPAKPVFLNNLSASYRSRFNFSGAVEDIDEAVTRQIDAISLTPDGHPLMPSHLGNLGNSYLRRFHRLNQPEDLKKAISYQEQAVQLIPEGHPDRAQLLNNLGSSYERRFLVLGALADIDKAIDCLNQALSLAPSGSADRPMCLGNLGSAHKSRYRQLKERADIDKAINCLDQAIDLTRDGYTNMASRHFDLGIAYFERFESPFGSIEDSDEAIMNLGLAEIFLPKGHNRRLSIQSNLGNMWFSRYKRSNEGKDLERALRHFQRATAEEMGPPRLKFAAATKWAEVMAPLDTTHSLIAYVQTMELLQEVMWVGAAVGSRYKEARELVASETTTEAATVAIEAEKPDLALEWLDQGRSIVWNQILQLRAPFDELTAVNPDLARQLKDIASQLDQSASFENTDRTKLSVDANSLEQEAQHHRWLAKQWDTLLAEARKLPGMSNYLRFKGPEELVRAAHSSTVVVINVSRKRCDALIIPEGTTSVTHLPLLNFSYEMAQAAHADLLGSLQHAHVRDRGLRRPVFEEVDSEDKFESVLNMLWDHVACPILDHLGFLSKETTGQLPHITWCATGSLAFLPIHAAGYYDDSPSRVFDYVVSSYTPTLATMLVSHQQPSDFRGILAVGQANTAGCTPLPGTVAELQAISTQTGSLRYTQLDGENATREAILSGMESHDWVHMACHGSQNSADPTKSAFHLHDGALDLAAITRKSMSGASLAFLSACQTATGDENLPEEAVHLAAGMIVAGYRAVIATMWSIHDSDAPVIAEKVYGSLLKDGVPDARRAGQALHEAVDYLRNKVGEKEYSRWVPYVHFGV